ncbi:Regulator of sigma-E protease RseP [Carnimonas sp. R-84981]|uniref:RIP metalloprotease RseP n=1 Tax=Carnimonas bestiolae TaxID=3402172 RepID=UPI003EDC7DD4
MGIIENIIAVIVVLGVLITFHEYGHFFVARRCGVKVLHFSVGFGKPLWSIHDRHGTRFSIAAIPLGGYVKMLDEREGPVAPEERHRAFNQASVLRRILIVAAGPLANFLLAWVIYWALFVYGISALVPVVGQIAPDSPASRSGIVEGEQISRVEGREVLTWEDINLRLVDLIGRSGSVSIDTTEHHYELPVERYLVGEDPSNPLQPLGMSVWQPKVAPRIQRVVADSPAAQAGLKAGDVITQVNDQSVSDWGAFVAQVQQAGGHPLQLHVENDGVSREVKLTPQLKQASNGKNIGYIGAAAEMPAYPSQYIRDISFSPWQAVPRAVGKTWDMIQLTTVSIGKMVVGLISPSNLSGPVTIARVAGDSARGGVEAFGSFLAYLSISLGVLNLLPIPMLDGGHLLYFVVEAVRGRPLSEKVQILGLKIGMLLVGTLMVLALYFDLMRL